MWVGYNSAHMTDETGHRIWAHAALSWLALILLPTTAVAIQWMRGIGRDSDLYGVHELILFFVLISSVPAALVAFVLLAPLAIAADRAIRGRTTRAANVLLGGVLGIPAFALFVAGSAAIELAKGMTFDRLSASFRVFTHDPETAVVVAMFVVSGMLVGPGLRYRRTVRG